MEADGIHPNFAGQRIIARALLDALGDADIAVPEVLKPLLMPGVISDWKLRIAPNGKPLVKDDVLRLTPDASWTDYPLPETMPVDGWLDQERQRGFAVSVAKVLGSDKPIQGYATLMNDDKGTEHSFFNTGAQLQTIWLNGTRVYQSMSWTGWHAGKERIPVDLLPGKNTVIVESTGPFFLSVTDSDKW